jgi:hypothetical protein
MAIESVFQRLVLLAEAELEAMQDLALTAIEDRPAKGGVLLIERLGDLVEALRGWSTDIRHEAVAARAAVTHPADFSRARGALTRAGEAMLRLRRGFFDEAVKPETIEALRQFGRQRGGEWSSWVSGMTAALDASRPSLAALDEALLNAWVELTERLATRSISVQTIGQQISAPLPAVPAGAMQDGLT